MSGVEDIEEALAIAGVHEGFPHERHDLARDLFIKDVTADDVELLAEHCRRTVREPGSPVKVLAALLVNDGERGTRLTDLRKVAALRASQQSVVPGKSQWVDPRQMDPDHQWAHSTNRRIAYASVYADRRPVDSVAIEMGLSVAQVKKLADEERKDRMKDVPQAVKSHLTPEQEKWRDEWLKMTPQQRRAAVLEAAKKQKVSVAP